ncbi:MAG TPA: DUF4241 domain-containing protein [Candidatus Obscuribacterales bacterium]
MFTQLLTGIGGAILGLASILALLAGFVWIVELIRRHREDRSGFSEFIKSGARMQHPALLSAFEGKGPEAPAGAKPRLETISCGRLRLKSGQVFVCDPAFCNDKDLEPFDEPMPEGEHPVHALIIDNDGDQRVAAVKITVNDQSLHHIEPAWTASARANALKHRILPAFGVDSANAAVFSFESLESMRADTRDPSEFVPGPDDPKINPYLSGRTDDLWKETVFADGSNCFLFLSGLGDGAYPCYFGKTEQGSIVCLLIDFGFFGEPTRIGYPQAQ